MKKGLSIILILMIVLTTIPHVCNAAGGRYENLKPGDYGNMSQGGGDGSTYKLTNQKLILNGVRLVNMNNEEDIYSGYFRVLVSSKCKCYIWEEDDWYETNLEDTKSSVACALLARFNVNKKGRVNKIWVSP